MKLCNYRCGKIAKIQFENGKWCCSENWHRCSEMRRRQAEKMIGRTKENDEVVRKMVKTKTGRTKDNNEGRRKAAEKMMGRTKENNEGRRIAAEKTSKKLKGRTKENDERVRRMAEKVKENWKDPEYQRKQKEARDLKPNKCETLILNILNKLYSNEWKYTGDLSFLIDGKNPDFTCINGKKLLIEHFGTYWHEGDDPEERKKIFSEFGYKTLIIWENELKDIEEVENKIKMFVEETSYERST